MKSATRFFLLVAALALSACGGGGSSSSSGGSSSGAGTTYTVGGTLSGLTASGGALQINGGDTLTISSNGSFQFTDAIASGSAYAVTVSTQPGGQHCSVTNGTGTATATVNDVTVTCTSNNVAAVSVGTFPADVTQDDFNVPLVTINVCNAQGTCKPFQVIVDTGSSGLRLMGSSLAAAGLTLPAVADPANAANDLYECAYYADGYAWGSVNTATVEIPGVPSTTTAETASNIPVQVITAAPPAVPNDCSNASTGANLNTPNAFSADGVLGVGINAQDCGSACVTSALFYYSCSSTSGCLTTATATTIALANQVVNPVSAFGTDDNGVVLALPSIAATGAATATGTLTFGIGTQTDNAIGSAVVLPISGSNSNDQEPQYVSTTFQNTAEDGIIDSGSNAFFFADSALESSLCVTTSPEFYCPSATQSLTAINSSGGATSDVAFQIASLDDLHSANPTFYAFDNVGGPLSEIGGVTYFDFGLPFFFGRSVFTIIEGASVGGTAYPLGAFAYLSTT